ncbi:MAG: FecR domain-containing protein [Pseudomonadota bacterium]
MIEQGSYQQALKEAHQWREALYREEVSEKISTEFERWLAHSHTHQKAYKEALSFWQALEGLEAPLTSPLKQSHEVRRKNDFLLFWKSRLLDTLSATHLVGAGVAAFIFVVVAFFSFQPLEQPSSSNAKATAFASQTAEIKTIQLEDGSILILSADTSIKATLSDTQRRIELEKGAVFFDVTKDEKRPFVVYADDFIVSVLGTSFEVSRDNDVFRAAVESGVVDVSFPYYIANKASRANAMLTLDAGQQAFASVASGLKAEQGGSVSAIAQWRKGKISYQGETLNEVIAELNRFSAKPILLDQWIPADSLRLRGTFDTSNIEAVIRTIASVHSLQADISDNKIVLTQED